MESITNAKQTERRIYLGKPKLEINVKQINGFTFQQGKTRIDIQQGEPRADISAKKPRVNISAG